MDSHYKQALINTIDEMTGYELVNHFKELMTAGVMVLSIIAIALFVIAI